jgi:O-antigen/teichoic acid export membrane protein
MTVARALLRDGAAYGFAAFFNMAAFRIDAVMLEAMKGPRQVGIYSVAYRFFEPLLFVTWGLASAALPRFVRDDRGGRRSRTYELGVAGLLAVYLPVAVGEPFAGRWIVTSLFGARYVSAVPAVGWLTTALIFYGVAHFTRMALIGVGHRREILIVSVVALALNVGANALVIPRHGFVGAAEVTLWTEIVECALLVAYYLRAVGGWRGWRPTAVPIAATAVMAAVLAAAGLRDAGAVVAGLVVYPAALVGLALLLDREDAQPALRGVIDKVRRRPPSADAEVMADVTAGLAAEDDAGLP